MKVTVMLKDGDYDTVDIPYKQISVLSRKIENDGYVKIPTTKHQSLQIVGLVVTGKRTGTRALMLGKWDKEAEQFEENR